MPSAHSDAQDDGSVGSPTAGAPLELTHAQMNAAYDNGHAVPFAGIPWLIRYDGAWWVIYEGGWLRIIDQPTADSLDQRAALMTDADVNAARTTAIRGALADSGADMGDIKDMHERLETATGITGILAQSWAACDLIRATLRRYQDRAGDAFAAYTMAAAAAVRARNLLAAAPSIPPGHTGATNGSPSQSADAAEIADMLANLASLLSNRLISAAQLAVQAADRDACQQAAAEAESINALLIDH
jgi:hypothetical protein